MARGSFTHSRNSSNVPSLNNGGGGGRNQQQSNAAIQGTNTSSSGHPRHRQVQQELFRQQSNRSTSQDNSQSIASGGGGHPKKSNRNHDNNKGWNNNNNPTGSDDNNHNNVENQMGTTNQTKLGHSYGTNYETTSSRKRNPSNNPFLDPSVLLARGYTARYLGSVLLAPIGLRNGKTTTAAIRPLSNEEIERDLHLFTTYNTATTRYHQVQYVTRNRITQHRWLGKNENNNNNTTIGSSSSTDPANRQETVPTATVSSNAMVSSSNVTPSGGVSSGQPLNFYPARNYVNPLNNGNSNNLLPVRIDPDEEKRVMIQRKKIMKGEIIRENLEQKYMSLMAHFNMTTKELNTLKYNSYNTIKFLQETLQKKALLLSIQRIRLQYIRDSMNTIQVRQDALVEWKDKYALIHQHNNDQLNSDELDRLAIMSEDTCPLLQTWNELENFHLKEALLKIESESTFNTNGTGAAGTTMENESGTSSHQISTTAGGGAGAAGSDTSHLMNNNNSTKNIIKNDDDVEMRDDEQSTVDSSKPNKRKKKNSSNKDNNNKDASSNSSNNSEEEEKDTILWPCTVQPVTPRGIPLLVSALSKAPENTMAVSTAHLFGSSQHSLTWLESYLPEISHNKGISNNNRYDESDLFTTLSTIVENDNTAIVSPTEYKSWNELPTKVQKLRDEVDQLQKELVHEQSMNQTILSDTCKLRVKNDEWVAMIALVRQETENVLHRHNILLESDVVGEAIAKYMEDEQRNREANGEDEEGEEEEEEPVEGIETEEEEEEDEDDVPVDEEDDPIQDDDEEEEEDEEEEDIEEEEEEEGEIEEQRVEIEEGEEDADDEEEIEEGEIGEDEIIGAGGAGSDEELKKAKQLDTATSAILALSRVATSTLTKQQFDTNTNNNNNNELVNLDRTGGDDNDMNHDGVVTTNDANDEHDDVEDDDDDDAPTESNDDTEEGEIHESDNERSNARAVTTTTTTSRTSGNKRGNNNVNDGGGGSGGSNSSSQYGGNESSSSPTLSRNKRRKVKS